MLLRRGDRWLMSVRGPQVGYAPGTIGLVGGHVEPADHGRAVLEATARRELKEETGLDLPDLALTYLESEVFVDDVGLQVSVAFVAEAPDGVEPVVGAPAELDDVGWWTLTDLESDPRCPDWLPGLVRRAARLERLSR